MEVMVSCLPFARRDVSGLSEFTESSCPGLPAAPSGAGEEKGEAHYSSHQPSSVLGDGEGTSGGGLPTLFAGIRVPALDRHQLPQPSTLYQCDHPQ